MHVFGPKGPPSAMPWADAGMKALTHVATWSADAWPEWSLHALAFAKSWKGAFENSDTKTRDLSTKRSSCSILVIWEEKWERLDHACRL